MINSHNKHDCNVNFSGVDTSKEQDLKDSTKVDNNIIDPRDNQIIQLKVRLAQMVEHERDAILRLKAEIENMRRRNIQEIEKVHKFALERFAIELLPIIDNLERTSSIMNRSDTALSAIMEGIDLTLKSFLDTVLKFGIKPIYEVHIPFNPEIHQAISMTESEEHQPNQVLTIIQKGYMLNGRLIRPAMVTVSRSKC